MWIVLGVLAVAAVWLFNSAVRLRNRAREAFSGIDVQLKRRHDLVPNLVRVVGAYARHEREALEEVTRLRGAAEAATAVPERERTERGLDRGIVQLLAVVERYPDLKADTSFRRLQDDLVELEDHLQYARRYYNGAVRDFNTRIEQFPGSVLAAFCGWKPLDLFQVTEAEERGAPRIREVS
ncbi:MAG: LemA family protein [Planctomycetes bacterium]|nr:LemA family protein [Planctomycetota bacterium]